jgi:hypothetical protein
MSASKGNSDVADSITRLYERTPQSNHLISNSRILPAICSTSVPSRK